MLFLFCKPFFHWIYGFVCVWVRGLTTLVTGMLRDGYSQKSAREARLERDTRGAHVIECASARESQGG